MTPNDFAAVLRATMPNSGTRADAFAPALLEHMPAFAITGQKRVAAFLGTIAEESGEFRWTREIWGPTPAQLRYEPPGEKADDLGNTQPGDGFRYRGRGLIQITGRANYRAASSAIGTDFLGEPQLMEQPDGAVLTACWFWQAHGCNELADIPDFKAVTRRVNGGLTHYDRRKAYYDRALAALGGSDATD